MKYIVLQVITKDIVRELPFIFPEAVVHSQMKNAMSRLLTFEYKADSVTCVSAGFISSIGVGTVGQCYGESESIGVKSRGPEDDKLLMMLDYTHGLKL